MQDYKKIEIETIDDLHQWLLKNHTAKQSVWLVRFKKSFTENYITYDEIVDELLCFGWIDSLPRKLDEQRTMLLISPRKATSSWSKVNKEKAEKLILQSRIHKSGLLPIELAKQNGSWSFLEDVDELKLPDDLTTELNKNPKALLFFENFPRSSKRGILEWIKNAKTPATRQKRILETVAKAENNIKANHPAGRDKGPVLRED